MRWDAVNARARGLATHLLGAGRLQAAARTASLPDLIHHMAEAGYLVGDARTTAELDRAIGRTVAHRLSLLERWLEVEGRSLAVVYEDEDRRTLRRLLRGMAQGVSPASRLRGVNPTPALPARRLERLASAASPGDLVAELARQGHPAGRVLTVALGEPRVAALGLLGLEAALGRLFASRATRAARRSGALVRALTRQLIDLENAWTLLQAGAWGKDVVGDDLWLPGGEVLPPEECARIEGWHDPDRIREALRMRFAASPLAPVFEDPAGAPSGLERQALAAQVAWLEGMATRDPLSPATVLSIIQRIRAEARDLRAILAGLALNAPGPAIERQLVGVS